MNMDDKVNMFKFGDDDRNRQVMQSMQDLFCRSNHIYAVCYGLTYNKITGFSEVSVCEDVVEHWVYWKEHINNNPEDCCNLKLYKHK